MSRNLSEIEENMVIKKKNFKPIVEALTTFAKTKIKNKPYYSAIINASKNNITDRNAANIYFGKDPKETNDLTTILSNMLFEPEFDKNGDLKAMHYAGESLYDAFKEFFEIIAPFVEPESYISFAFAGENPDYFQYVFDGKTMREKAGVIAWEETPKGISLCIKYD